MDRSYCASTSSQNGVLELNSQHLSIGALPLLERKPHSLAFARPFENLHLPECFEILSRRMEAELENGVKEYIGVLRLLETYSLKQLTKAIEKSLRLRVHSTDGIKHFLPAYKTSEPATFSLPGMTPKTVPLWIRGYPIRKVGFYRKDALMKRKFHTPEQIVKKLREADAAIASGSTIEQVCRQLQISDATYYNWRKQYGQMKLDQVKQLKSLQKENARLKKLVADLSLDKAILKESLSGNY